MSNPELASEYSQPAPVEADPTEVQAFSELAIEGGEAEPLPEEQALNTAFEDLQTIEADIRQNHATEHPAENANHLINIDDEVDKAVAHQLRDAQQATIGGDASAAELRPVVNTAIVEIATHVILPNPETSESGAHAASPQEADVTDTVPLGEGRSINREVVDDTARALAELPPDVLGDALKATERAGPAGPMIVREVTEVMDAIVPHGPKAAESAEQTPKPLNEAEQSADAILRTIHAKEEQERALAASASGETVFLPESTLAEAGRELPTLDKMYDTLNDPDLSAATKAELFATIYDIQLDQGAEPDELGGLYGREQRDLQRNIMNATSPDTFRHLQQLAEGQGARVDAILTEVRSQLTDSIRDKTVLARTQGFASLADKYTVQEHGLKMEGFVSAVEVIPSLEDQAEIQHRALDFLTKELGMDQVPAMLVSMGLEGRASREVDGVSQLNGEDTETELLRFQDVLEHIGLESAELLREKCGIINLGEFSYKQADRMVRFAQGDPELLEELSQKEVCVVLRDATSDWNGAFAGMNATYETVENATLFFEISRMDSVTRELDDHIGSILESGVKPSAVVVAGHGFPGAVHLGNGYLLGRNRRDESQQRGDLQSLDQSRLTDLFATMKPDRDGNCSVIFKSCSQAAAISENADSPGESWRDSTLVHAANLAQASRIGDASYQIIGTEKSSNVRVTQSGRLEDTFNAEPLRSIYVGKYGGIHRIDSADGVALPMFIRPTENE